MKVYLGPWRKNRAKKVEIIDDDLFSMDHTMATILHPLFVRFRDRANGCVPCCMFKETNGKEEEEEDWKKGEQNWIEIIDKIIYSLGEIASNNSNKPEFKGNFDWENNMELIGITEEEYQEWKILRNDYEKKIQEGLDLLGKYFQNFWY